MFFLHRLCAPPIKKLDSHPSWVCWSIFKAQYCFLTFVRVKKNPLKRKSHKKLTRTENKGIGVIRPSFAHRLAYQAKRSYSISLDPSQCIAMDQTWLGRWGKERDWHREWVGYSRFLLLATLARRHLFTPVGNSEPSKTLQTNKWSNEGCGPTRRPSWSRPINCYEGRLPQGDFCTGGEPVDLSTVQWAEGQLHSKQAVQDGENGKRLLVALDIASGYESVVRGTKQSFFAPMVWSGNWYESIYGNGGSSAVLNSKSNQLCHSC